MNITYTKAHFSEVINQVIAGEEIIVEKMGMPVAKIIRYIPEKRPKLLGLMKGKSTVPDDFATWPTEEAEILGIMPNDGGNV